MNKPNIYINIIIFQFIIGCSRLQTLNMVEYDYAYVPKNIIWLQIAGLSEEHLTMLRFSRFDGKETTVLEKSACFGKTWNFNLYKIRPNAHESFLSQLMGRKNINNSCTDYNQDPIWNYFDPKNSKIGILEVGANNQNSLSKAWGCEEESKLFTKGVVFWKMSQKNNSDENLFHYQSKDKPSPGIYYDKSCQKKDCYTSTIENTLSLFKKLNDENKNNILNPHPIGARVLLFKKGIFGEKLFLASYSQN